MRARPLLARLSSTVHSWCLPLVICMALLNMLDLKAQVAYAYSMPPPHRDQQEKTNERPLEKRINLQVKNEHLEQVLEKIEQQTTYVFVYSNDLIKTTQRISLNVKDKQLSEVLPMLLSPLNVSYELIDSKIILRQGNAPAAEFLQQQEVTVNGRVVDDKGEGVPGVNIRLKGATIVTIKNEDVFFTLKVPNGRAYQGTFGLPTGDL